MLFYFIQKALSVLEVFKFLQFFPFFSTFFRFKGSNEAGTGLDVRKKPFTFGHRTPL